MYSRHGYLTQYKHGATVLEEVTDTDAFGSATESRFVNSALRTSRTFDAATGWLTSVQTGTTATPKSIQDLEYAWRSNSTLYTRKDKRNTPTTADDYTDTFTYDPMERVTRQATTVGASRTLDFAYDKPGNLTSKQSNVGADLDVTGYTYGTAGKPHRLTAVTIGGVANTLFYADNGNIIRYERTGDWTYLTYDGRNNVTRITVGSAEDTLTPTARDEFWYMPDGDRYLGRETWDDAGTQRSAITTYLGAFEEVGRAANSSFPSFRPAHYQRNTFCAAGRAR